MQKKQKYIYRLCSVLALSSSFLCAKQLAVDTALDKIQEIQSFYDVPKNRVYISAAIDKNIYAWQHTSRYNITDQVLRDGDIFPLKKEIDSKIDALTFAYDGEKRSISAHLDKYPVDAFMVLKHGKIVYERYNTMRPIDKHLWYSNGKIVTGTLLAMLEDEGKIDLSKAVSDYLPRLKGTAWDAISVENAANMATGLDSTEHDEPNHDERSNPKQGWMRWAMSLDNTFYNGEDAFEMIASMKPRYKPNQRFEYNSINTFLLGRIIESIEKKPLNEIFSSRIWQKIGAAHDGYVYVSKKEGYALMYGTMNSTLEDMARFAMIYTPSSRLFHSPILKQSIVSAMQKSGDSRIYDKASTGQKFSKAFPSEKLKNGYQWDILFEDGDMFKSGTGGQGIYVSPSKDVVVVWFSTSDGKSGEVVMAREIAKYLGK